MMEILNELKLAGFVIASILFVWLLVFYIKLSLIDREIYRIADSLEKISNALENLNKKFDNNKDRGDD